MIFISYRRDDESYFANLLFEALQAAFGIDSVIMDIDSIPLGVDFRVYVAQKIKTARVTIAIIGPKWEVLQELGDSRRIARIMNPNDYVRCEIEMSRDAGIPIIPIYVSRMAGIDAKSLPKSLRFIPFLNGLIVESNAAVKPTFRRLTASLELLLRNETASVHIATGAAAWKESDQLVNADFAGIAIDGIPLGWDLVCADKRANRHLVRLVASEVRSARYVQIEQIEDKELRLQQRIVPSQLGQALRVEADIELITGEAPAIFIAGGQREIATMAKSVRGLQCVAASTSGPQGSATVGIRVNAACSIRVHAFRAWTS